MVDTLHHLSGVFPGTRRRALAGEQVHGFAGAEAELLLSCVRAVMGTESATDINRRMPSDLHWAAVVRKALEHGVLPHLYTGLTASGTSSIPAAVLDNIRGQFRANARSAVFRSAELMDVLRIFDAHTIQTLSLKGPVLAHSIYGSVAMRQFTDLDLLVPAPQAVSARELLRVRGYDIRSQHESGALAVRDRAHGSVVIDLQWALAEQRYRFPITEKDLRARAQPLAFMNGVVWQPRPEDQLLLLCGHAAKHCWSRLGWLSDAGAFVQAHGHRLDWPRAMDRARRMGGERLVLISLQLAADLLWLPVPREVRPRLRADRVVVPLATELGQQLFHGHLRPERLNASYGLVEAGLLYMRSRERIADKMPYARYLASVLLSGCSLTPNARDREVIALPSFLAFLYFVIRPMRLARKYGVRLLRCGVRAAGCWR